MASINTNILSLYSPRVMYSPYHDEFFLQTGTLYRTPGEYEDPKDIYQDHEEENFMSYPIDENGYCYEDIRQCVPIGRRGDEISQFHEAIMLSCRTVFPENIPRIMKRIRETLGRYGIVLLDDRKECMEMSVKCLLLDGGRGYRFTTGESYPCNLPFVHDYDRADYSDLELGKDIAATLKVLFSVLPAPRRLVLGVDNVDGSRYNENVVRLLDGFRAFDFEITCRGKSR
jgi:hypothetical protein